MATSVFLGLDTGGGGASAVGGATTEVLFNDAGTEAGDPGLTYNKTTDTVSVVGQVLAGDGSVAAPAFSFAGATGTGMYRNAGELVLGTAGASRYVIGNGYTNLEGPHQFGWSDLRILRAGANILAQRNAAASQELQVGPTTGYAIVSNTGIGYSVGLGGAVTQATSKATGVTLSTVTGNITMNVAALAANTTVSFVLTNTIIAAADQVVVTHTSAGTGGAYVATGQAAAGSATIFVRNVTAGSLGEAIVLKFVVIKGAVA